LLLGFLFQGRFGFAEFLQAALRIGQVRRQRIGGLPFSVTLIFLLIGLFGCGQQIGDHFLPVFHAIFDFLVGHGSACAGVGQDLGAVNGHVAEFHQSGFLTQPESLQKEGREILHVLPAKVGDGGVTGLLIGRKVAEGQIVEGGPLDAPRTGDADGVTVQQQAGHHQGIVGGLAATVFLVLGIEGRQVQLFHHVANATGQVIVGKPVVEGKREKELLIEIAISKSLAHLVILRIYSSLSSTLC